MNVATAKQTSIISILEMIYQIHPKSENERVALFFSPIHEEKTPSFKVDKVKNVWFDHGEGRGGTTIDLVCLLSRCNIPEALRVIGGMIGDANYKAPSPVFSSPAQSSIELISIYPLSNYQLKYVTDRGISEVRACSNLKTLKYKNNAKEYYGVGFKNDADGWEVSASSFKACLGVKEITTIKGQDSSKISIFEGFFDYLSALEYFDLDNFKGDVVVLNSLSMIKHVDFKMYKNIFLFLDNDKAGNKATLDIVTDFSNAEDKRNYYSDHKDFNEFLTSLKS